jgi:hypothetical protein
MTYPRRGLRERTEPSLDQLIDNAIDATQGRGELVLRTYTKDGYVAVEIIDNGPGIPPEVQPRIFEPFFTTKAPGVATGLGLHIAYNIVVHKHRGRSRLLLNRERRASEWCCRFSSPEVSYKTTTLPSCAASTSRLSSRCSMSSFMWVRMSLRHSSSVRWFISV